MLMIQTFAYSLKILAPYLMYFKLYGRFFKGKLSIYAKFLYLKKGQMTVKSLLECFIS